MFEREEHATTWDHKDRRVCAGDIGCGAPEPDSQLTLDIEGRSEASSLVPKGAIPLVRASIWLAEGEAGESAARSQGEALLAIARSLGLDDDKEVS